MVAYKNFYKFCRTSTEKIQTSLLNKDCAFEGVKHRLLALKFKMSGICAACEETLFVLLEDSDEEDSKAIGNVDSVLDDVELGCGCHFHW